MQTKSYLTDEVLMKLTKNFHKDNPDYEVRLIEFSEEVEVSNVQYTEQVWDDLDAPVNKTFDRNERKTFISYNKPYVIIHCDDYSVHYLSCHQNKWYCLTNSEYDEIKHLVKTLKTVTETEVKPEGVQNGN